MVGGSVLGFGLAVALGIVGHAIGISLVGHYVISHDRHPNLPRPIAALAYTLFFYCSMNIPHLWAALHIAHHKHADTDKDPHSPAHQGKWVWLATWDPALMDARTYVKHTKSKLSNFFLDWYIPLAILPFAALLFMPLETFLMYWMIPGPIALTIGTGGAYLTHIDKKPVSGGGVIKFFVFAGEMFNHDKHHAFKSRRIIKSIKFKRKD